jgi:hypothetical protein
MSTKFFIGNPEGKRLLEGIRLWETDGSEALDVSVQGFLWALTLIADQHKLN